jgi:hypothetical protein
MNAALQSTYDWGRDAVAAWDRFWFKSAHPHTLALIRILAGGMMLYTHLVWTLDLPAFFGPKPWLTTEVTHYLRGDSFAAWSIFNYVSSPAAIWTLHIVGLVVFALLTLGLFSRVSSVLACIFTLMYCHRLEGALFGLDQVNAMLATYLMVGPCGAVYSLDRLIQRARAKGPLPEPAPSVSANIAIRLIQLHMCVIYLFGGIGKMRGETWWIGSAFWLAVANAEYQSIDMTWLVHFSFLASLLAHVTVFWEAFYCFLIWPRLTRPICLAMAVAVHGGIALFLGMITFGLAMLIGNLAFVPPELIRSAFARLSGLFARGERHTSSDKSRASPSGEKLPAAHRVQSRSRAGSAATG